ncbi:L-threonylcarbamoyladenylate synthase [Chloroflexota bacterium]
MRSVSARLSSRVLRKIEKAADIIKSGGVVAFPTDTVYGLGASPFKREAVDRLYDIKQRPRSSPMPVLLGDESQVDAVATSVPDFARLLMRRFWPGGLTVVLYKALSFPFIATDGETTIGIRIPNHDIARSLIRLAGVPVIGTSANLSGQPNTLTAKDVEYQLGGTVDLIVDGGKCPGGVESTVVDVTGPVPVILRRGAVPEEEIIKAYREYVKEAGKHACSSGK